MNAIFIFSTPWAFDPDQRIHEILTTGRPLVPNASLCLNRHLVEDRPFDKVVLAG
jgi:hypothetical protein